MRTTKRNRWSDYKPAETAQIAELDFVQPPSKLTFQVQGAAPQRIEYLFMKGRPQLAILFAKVLLSEGKRYTARTRSGIVCALRVFNQFIEQRRPDVNHTSKITYELLQEFAAWMIYVREYHVSTASNLFSGVRRLLNAAASLYPNAFGPEFDTPVNILPRRRHPATRRALSEEVLQRLMSAAKREANEVRDNYREGNVPEGVGSLTPFLILIAMKTAINAESLYNIKRDCLKPHIVDTNAYYVVWDKWRSKTGKQQQLHYTDPRGRGVIEMLRFLCAYTQPLVPQARKRHRGMLLLYRYRHANGGTYKVAAATSSEINNRALNAFCKRNQLPEIKMFQLRPSAATHHYVKTGGQLRKVQLLLGHADMTTTERYIEVPLVQVLHDKSIRAAQDEMLARVTRAIPKETKHGIADFAGHLSPRQVEKIAKGEHDTGLCKCRDPFDSPQPGQHKGQCCTLFLACLACPNALFFLEDLPRVIALRDHLLSEKENMPRGIWDALYKDRINIIERDIIANFSESQVAEAERLTAGIADMPVLVAKGVLK